MDRALQSLLQLSDSCQLESFQEWGVDILIDPSNVARVVREHSRSLWNNFSSLKKKEGKKFLYSKFLISNGIPIDRIIGEFPVVFRDYRRTLHSLKLAWAFYLTLKMKRVKLRFQQRVRGGRFVRGQENQLTQLFCHIYQQLQKLGIRDESQIIKCLKTSLCRHVSVSLEQQELPDGIYFNVVPIPFRPILDKLSHEEQVNFYFSLLQSKALCQEVPKSFVQAALEKHRQLLSSPHPGVSETALEDLRERGRAFGKIVKRFYQPNSGFNPTNKATCHFPRNGGGVKGDLVYHDVLHSNEDLVSQKDRMEPFVIGLFGQPGMGKSSLIPELLASLSKLFPKTPWGELTYERSCNVDHWDGYKGQPIVILDDLGQSLKGEDIREFQTLVSCNPYILPMADLPAKGMYFTSPIIIATSNLQYGHSLPAVYEDANGILDDASFWRRFTFPLYLEHRRVYELRQQPNWVKPSNLIINTVRPPGSNLDFDHSTIYYQSRPTFGKEIGNGQGWKQDLWREADQKSLGESLRKCYKERCRFHDNIRKTWTQKVNHESEDLKKTISAKFYEEQVDVRLQYPQPRGGNWSDSSRGNEDPFFNTQERTQLSDLLVFPSFPPPGPLPVRVEPVTEPLKVRTITAGIGQTFCLKPLQRAMWLALGEEEQFCLTHGTNRLPEAVERIFNQSQPGDVWISGDYTAATDSFAIEASKALMEGILESIDHMPTRRWAMKEISPHLLIYPRSSNLDPVIQQSGQLMGSLLSFPLLCLLNDCTAKSIGLLPSQYLINGDDILMRTKADNYAKWKDRVSDYGLSLSLGKNYVHEDYGTVNSQLIFRGSLLSSGKQRVLDRRSQVLGECLRDLELMMTDCPTKEVVDLFKSVNRQKLSRTVRSIQVPVSHGGLSLHWGDRLEDREHRTAILAYVNDLLRKIQPSKGCVSIPYLSCDEITQVNLDEMSAAFNEPPDSKEFLEDFLSREDLERVQKRIKGNPSLRDLLLGQRIESLPPLNFLRVIQVPIKEGSRKTIQQSVDRLFFRNFLHPNEDFTYELFLKNTLAVTRNEKRATVRDQDLIDLGRLESDFVGKISFSYRVLSFDKNQFEGSLSKALSPKQFNLPCFPDSVDFSVQIQEDFQMLLNALQEDDHAPEVATVLEGTVQEPSSELKAPFNLVSSPSKKESCWKRAVGMDFPPEPDQYWMFDTDKTEL